MYDDYFKTHFDLMYNDIFKDTYDTYENRYKLCFKEYMNGIKYNRSKIKYINTSNKYVLECMYDKILLEERTKLKALSYDVVIPFEYIKTSLPSILPDAIKKHIFVLQFIATLCS